MTASGGPESTGVGTAAPLELGKGAPGVVLGALPVAVGVLAAGDPAAPPWHAARTSVVASTNPAALDLRLSLKIWSTCMLLGDANRWW
jgi:hypothetical protein